MGQYPVQVLEELMEVFMFFIFWIIKVTPFAIISLIANAIGQQDDIWQVFKQLGYLVAATCIGFALQVVIVYICLYYMMVRSNPFTYLSKETDSSSDDGASLFTKT